MRHLWRDVGVLMRKASNSSSWNGWFKELLSLSRRCATHTVVMSCPVAVEWLSPVTVDHVTPIEHALDTARLSWTSRARLLIQRVVPPVTEIFCPRRTLAIFGVRSGYDVKWDTMLSAYGMKYRSRLRLIKAKP